MSLASIRKEKGITQKELADKLGTKQNNISRYENGTRIPNLYRAKEIATALGCTVDELLKEEDDDKSGVRETA